VHERRQYLISLGAVAASLYELQLEFPKINKRLLDRRDELEDFVIANMLDGYAYINTVIENRLDLFAMGNLSHFLEMNARVLCGVSAEARHVHAGLTCSTERRFYEQKNGGIRDIVEWYDRHRGESVWRRAAGVYIRVLSEPQLFIEGNHRTGALMMSYVLARDGYPPFVLTAENARAYFDPSTLIKKTHKGSIGMLVQMPRMKKRFADFLSDQADRAYLQPAN
jgi:prophage maintenance system killer protein